MTAEQNIEAAVNLRRIQLLYSKMPVGIVSALLTMLVVFVEMMQFAPPNQIKAWASFMLSALALRGWIWYSFTTRPAQVDRALRWEIFAAVATFLTGLGWGALNSLLISGQNEHAGDIFVLLAVGISFSSAVYYGVSNSAYWAILVPTMLPAASRFVNQNADTDLLASVMTAALAVTMMVAVQQSMRRSLFDNLRHRIASEALLSEQQAIFQSATLGIAVVQDRCIVKANPRLAELFGQNVDALLQLPLEALFARTSELDLMVEDSAMAFRRALSYHGAFLLKRGDGRQFWAEFSGRRMDGDGPERSVWLITEAPLRRADGQRAQPQYQTEADQLRA